MSDGRWKVSLEFFESHLSRVFGSSLKLFCGCWWCRPLLPWLLWPSGKWWFSQTIIRQRKRQNINIFLTTVSSSGQSVVSFMFSYSFCCGYFCLFIYCILSFNFCNFSGRVQWEPSDRFSACCPFILNFSLFLPFLLLPLFPFFFFSPNSG